MTKLKEQAIEILQDIPDDKIIHVVEMLKGLKALYNNDDKKLVFDKTFPTAMGIFNKYANPDLTQKEKDAWGEAVKEKYANY